MFDDEFLLYLDSGDLLAIADGKAVGVGELREALDSAGGVLLVSLAHLADLAGADDETRERWLDAVVHLGPVRFATQPGPGKFASRRFLSETIASSQSEFGVFQEAMSILNDTHRAVHASGVNELPRPNLRLLRRANSALHDDQALVALGIDEAAVRAAGLDREAFRTSIQSLGFSTEELSRATFATAAEALSRGDLPEYLRRRLSDDRRRPGRHSDIADGVHLTFAVCADLFTVDANVESVLRGATGRPVQAAGRGPNHSDRSYFFRVGQLARVSERLCQLADEWRETNGSIEFATTGEPREP